MFEIEKLAEQIVSAQCSYDSQEHKQQLIEAFLAGVTTERNRAKRYNAVVEPYEGGTAYVRGWRAALGEIFKELKKDPVITICPPTLMQYMLDLINALAMQPNIETKISEQ